MDAQAHGKPSFCRAGKSGEVFFCMDLCRYREKTLWDSIETLSSDSAKLLSRHLSSELVEKQVNLEDFLCTYVRIRYIDRLIAGVLHKWLSPCFA